MGSNVMLVNLKKDLMKEKQRIYSGLHLKKVTNNNREVVADTIDAAVQSHDNDINYIMQQRDTDRIKVINNVLKRIDDGKYGVCESCGDTIHEKRLKAIPFVKFCISCQEDIEKTEHRSNRISIGDGF